MYEIAKRINPSFHNTNFFFCYGDDTTQINDVNFCKARRIGDDKKICLYLNTYRHFNHENLSIARDDDILFEHKISKAIWRGATTRCNSRFDLVNLWGENNKYIDVGFSQIDPEFNSKYELKKMLSVDEMVKYKYLIVLEGNDVASSFVWSFLTNSIVIMPKPKYEMITKQGQVIGGFHYIQIKDDTSDLEEKIIWCESHVEECKQIIENKKKFINCLLSNDLYEMSAKLIENNIVPYIDKYGLTISIFYKILLNRYIEDTFPTNYQPIPSSLFYSIKNSNEFKNKKQNNASTETNIYEFHSGIISIQKDSEIPNEIKTQCGFSIHPDKNTILIDVNKIVSNYNEDYSESFTEIIKMCQSAKIKPTGIFTINNTFYVFDYVYDNNIKTIDIYQILKNEYINYSSNNYNKKYNKHIYKSEQFNIKNIDIVGNKIFVFKSNDDFYVITM